MLFIKMSLMIHHHHRQYFIIYIDYEIYLHNIPSELNYYFYLNNVIIYYIFQNYNINYTD